MRKEPFIKKVEMIGLIGENGAGKNTKLLVQLYRTNLNV